MKTIVFFYSCIINEMNDNNNIKNKKEFVGYIENFILYRFFFIRIKKIFE